MKNDDILNSMIILYDYCSQKDVCDEKCMFFAREGIKRVCKIGKPETWKIPKILLDEIP